MGNLELMPKFYPGWTMRLYFDLDPDDPVKKVHRVLRGGGAWVYFYVTQMAMVILYRSYATWRATTACWTSATRSSSPAPRWWTRTRSFP